MKVLSFARSFTKSDSMHGILSILGGWMLFKIWMVNNNFVPPMLMVRVNYANSTFQYGDMLALSHDVSEPIRNGDWVIMTMPVNDKPEFILERVVQVLTDKKKGTQKFATISMLSHESHPDDDKVREHDYPPILTHPGYNWLTIEDINCRVTGYFRTGRWFGPAYRVFSKMKATLRKISLWWWLVFIVVLIIVGGFESIWPVLKRCFGYFRSRPQRKKVIKKPKRRY